MQAPSPGPGPPAFQGGKPVHLARLTGRIKLITGHQSNNGLTSLTVTRLTTCKSYKVLEGLNPKVLSEELAVKAACLGPKVLLSSRYGAQ